MRDVIVSRCREVIVMIRRMMLGHWSGTIAAPGRLQTVTFCPDQELRPSLEPTGMAP
jgi:hypothetical protein